MEKPHFWINTAIYYISIIGAISGSKAALFVTGILFLAIPHSTEAELIPGLRQSLSANIEVLKTQLYLDRTGYYEKIQ